LQIAKRKLMMPVESKTIAILATLDTKGTEAAYVAEQISSRGHRPLVIDVGTTDPPASRADVSRSAILSRADAALIDRANSRDRGAAVAAMGESAAGMLKELYDEGRIDAVIGMGGSGGTSITCRAMRSLPLGVPKVVVSTVAGGDVSAFVGAKDIVMIPAIVDLAGVNRISRGVLARAAGAVCGMAETNATSAVEDRPLIVASMFGNTTPCVEAAKRILEVARYEVLVFHATGSGGRTMEELIDSGLVAGVLDITTTEWADELCGGVMSAGPARLEAAARRGIPAVVAPGCLDMVNFWAPESVPSRYQGRRFYQHNPNVTLMRTNVEENQRLGEILAEKLNQSCGPVTVLLPLQGLSMIGKPDGPFHWPEADQALFSAIGQRLRGDIKLVKLDANINDPQFAERCAGELLSSISSRPASSVRTTPATTAQE
jgi:uncharacterized protein (UPF0261 family)